jgi:ribonuclease HI
MRVFTDGACSHNGRADAKAGYAVWFPDAKDLSESARLGPSEAQTNQRAELSAIHRAAVILDARGYHDSDVVIYTDSEYSINCLTKWISGWVSRGWKTAAGGDVLHKDLIQATSALLPKFKSHRFVHVRAHTGNEDDLSKNNDVVDRMARSTIDETVKVVALGGDSSGTQDELFEGCPLRLLGPPVPQGQLLTWLTANFQRLPAQIVSKHLLKAFTEACKERDVVLTKQTVQKTPVYRAERTSLQISHVTVEKVE